jgi:hypothetical protein
VTSAYHAFQTKIPLAFADEISQGFVAAASPYSEIAIATGGIRLREPETSGHIKILCKRSESSFVNRNNDFMMDLLKCANKYGFSADTFFRRNQSFYGSSEFGVIGVEIDTIVDYVNSKHQWGFWLFLTTGNSFFSNHVKRLARQRIGENMQTHSGTSWDGDRPIPLPDEQAVFSFCGLPEEIPMEIRRDWQETDT